ncbi:MAG: hypothetical protein OXG19_00800 [Chloroflexi bacterium]|nr:hypothetical protein [Chloroflexota bacterium]
MTDKPSAFLIMSFDEEFDAVYKRFIKPVLEDVGFEVLRADNIESQQNILRDIIEKIIESNLIVADLTNSNPNVFYELGLAHAFGKPVILVAQDANEVPFDLKQYRVLEYDTRFDRINVAKEELTRRAKGSLEGTIPVGSPVTDFYPDRTAPNQATSTPQSNTVSEDDRGFLDHQINLINGYKRIAKIATDMKGDLGDLNEAVSSATEEITQINARPSSSSPRAVRSVARRLAARIEKFNARMSQTNAEYADVAQGTEDSLEFVISFQLDQSEVSASEIDKQVSSLRDLQSNLITARDSCLDLAAEMDSVPRLERRLNRETKRGSEEVLVMAGNLDKTLASISRALQKYEQYSHIAR